MLTALYFFLFGLDLMGGSFGALGGKRAGQLFTITDNPIAGGGSLPMFTRLNILATIFVVGCAYLRDQVGWSVARLVGWLVG